MKTLYNLLLVLFLFPTIAFAHEIEKGKFTKQKTINKAYIVNADADISVDNSYGNVTVTTWNENKIELDILIKVSGDNEDWVSKRLDGITVSLEPLKSKVTAITKIDKNSGGRKGNTNSIEISYNIKIPKNGGVLITNKYGDISTTDLFAATTIKCKYGKITLGKLNGNTNQIDISYCNKSTIDYLNTATVSADYSGITINDYGTLNLNSDYTDVILTSGGNLKYDSSYGKINIGKISNLEGSGDYLSIGIQELFGNLKINTKYSKINVGQVNSKAGDINISSSYTAISINYNSLYLFDFDIKIKYGNLKYDQDLAMNSKQENGSVKSYSGYNKKTGSNKMLITSDYGNISLNKNQ